MAIRKPHLYIIDVGDSFRLLGDHFRRQGLSVNYVRLDEANVPLPPFAASERMLREEAEKTVKKNKRDLLGEMEVAARLIITGGEHKEEEEYRRSDKSFVRAAIVDAAKQAKAAGRPHASVSDFVEQFDRYLDGKVPYNLGTAIQPDQKMRISEIRNSARYFLAGFRSEIFNTEGEEWPDADVTIVDLGKIAMQDDYKDMLALSFIGLMNSIQSDAERRRGSGRQSLVLIDEAHMTTTNPMLAPYLAKGSKMWRKWGLWLWLATQNLEDFPDEASKILNMAEFWLCLSMPKAEIEQIARFKELTIEDKSLLQQARKESHKYVEAVLLSGREPLLLRNVPPALALALAQTEEQEVAERHKIMKEMGFDEEIDAVYEVERRIKESRVI